MIAKVLSCTIFGVCSNQVNVEVSIQKGLAKFDVVGLGQSAVKEGRDRIMTAIKTSGFVMESKRIIVNLAPAGVRKEGCSLDLPIALGVLVGNDLLDPNLIRDTAVMGELSLDGSIRPIRGVFAMIEELKKNGIEHFIVPFDNTDECDLFGDVNIFPAQTLSQVVDCLQKLLPWPHRKSVDQKKNSVSEDWSDVKGQPFAKRAMEIAAAGGHHVMLAGVPGVGKTLLARRFSTILPQLNICEEREVRKIQSLENDRQHEWEAYRPFRAPHHHASIAGIIGGGKQFRMGEFSMAHRGVLFMDEFPEFRKDIIEALREPLEEGVIRVSRAEGSFICPANFQLVAAMNLCPCGATGDEKKTCVCTPWSIQKYRNKLSGPIQDRLDLYVELKNTHWQILWNTDVTETSAQVRTRIVAARDRQTKRYASDNVTNASVPSKVLLDGIRLDAKSQGIVNGFVLKEGLSLRAIGRTMRVARTIADLENAEDVGFEHVCEALQYRAQGSV